MRLLYLSWALEYGRHAGSELCIIWNDNLVPIYERKLALKCPSSSISFFGVSGTILPVIYGYLMFSNTYSVMA